LDYRKTFSSALFKEGLYIKPSIKDIAKKANVSVSTVSRVLNNSKYVSDDLRERVLKAVEDFGYKPNLVARGLVKKRTNLIGVLIPRLANNFFAEIIEGIENLAHLYGYNILLSTSNNDVHKEIELLNVFVERQLDGIIFSVTEFTEKHQKFFDGQTVPTVFIGQEIEHGTYPYVTIDNVMASYEATKYLIKLKHQRIAIIAGPKNDLATGVDRLQGFLNAMKEEGLPIEPKWQVHKHHTIENGYLAASQIMAHKEKPTAIFACSDLLALGAINYLTEHGYSVPGDISVMGFDDINLASIFQPKLTTVKQFPMDIGSISTRLLIDLMEKGQVSDRRNLVPYRVVVRESTKPL
jgi:LacI family transcriptional regulator